MKKLYSLYETVSKVNSSLYTNLAFPTGVTVGASPGTDSIDDALLKDIDASSKAAGLKVSITTAVSGHKETTKSGNKSRHSTGNAVDIAMINGVAITKETGDKLVAELKKMGYDTSGSESGKEKSVLWQVADHYNHVHVSNNSGKSSTTDTSSTSTSKTDTSTSTSSSSSDFDTVAQNIQNGILGSLTSAAGMKESVSLKEQRLIKNIEKIKKLL
jgi:hypothetical protein